MDLRKPVDEQNQQAWVEIAHSTRVSGRMLSQLSDPKPGSNFSQAEQWYPYEKVSVRARAYLEAALEHMLLWADHAAPLLFHPDQVTKFTLRPAHTLARAALEAAAQAVWLMDPRDPRECIRRHLSLMSWDLQELRKSKLDSGDREFAKLKEEELIRRVSAVFTSEQIRPPRGYLAVIRDACASNELKLEPDEAERLWRAASGAAHGKYWPNIELRTIEVGDEYQPGHFRTHSYPDPASMTAILRAADAVVTFGVLRFTDYSGAIIVDALSEATEWLETEIKLSGGPA